MTTEKRKGRPKGSKNKVKEQQIVIEEKHSKGRPIGRPIGSKNKKNFVPSDTDEMTLDMQLIWGHLGTGSKTYINLKKNLELHKEDIPIFAKDYKKSFKRSPGYVVINPRNKHLIPYLKEEFPNIGVGGCMGCALWELRFCTS